MWVLSPNPGNSEIKWKSFFGGNLHVAGDFSKAIITLWHQKAMQAPSDPCHREPEKGQSGCRSHTGEEFKQVLCYLHSLFFFGSGMQHKRAQAWSTLALCSIDSHSLQVRGERPVLRTSVSWMPLWLALPPASPHTAGREMKPAAGLPYKANLGGGHITKRGSS